MHISTRAIYLARWPVDRIGQWAVALCHFLIRSYFPVPARCRVKVALHHTTSYCHKQHRSINRRRTRPAEQDKVFVTLDGIKNGMNPFLTLALTLTQTTTLSPNHLTTSNFRWPCTLFHLMCITQTSCMCDTNLRTCSTTQVWRNATFNLHLASNPGVSFQNSNLLVNNYAQLYTHTCHCLENILD